MSKETTKSLPLREGRHLDLFLTGLGIDIGGGDDPLPGAELWDWQQGDANKMLGCQRGHYDFVYSSHTLEHMINIPQVVCLWSSLVKVGGHIFTVVPDYTLYEKNTWPSKFNGDHKHSFSTVVTRTDTKRSNHWHIEQDLFSLFWNCGVNLVTYQVEDLNYDYTLSDEIDQTSGNALCQIVIIGKKEK